MSPNVRAELTIGELCRQLSQPLHRIEYVIRSRKIRPTSRAGHARVFDEADLQRIRGELDRIARDRSGNEAGQ